MAPGLRAGRPSPRPGAGHGAADLARDGGTHGPSQTITAGGLGLELECAEVWMRNHVSFEAAFDGGPPPGVHFMERYVDWGFGELFTDLKDTKAHFGTQPRPSPLVTIREQKADGRFKHRLIQDMRRSLINDAMHLPARQVFPRLVDHAIDSSRCAHARRTGQRARTLTLDFKGAFMPIPLNHEPRGHGRGPPQSTSASS